MLLTVCISRKMKKSMLLHDDVIKWKHFPRYWPLVREIHRSPVNFPHKGQWRGALMFTLICARINSWVNNGEAGDLRRHPGHYDVIVMLMRVLSLRLFWNGIGEAHADPEWPEWFEKYHKCLFCPSRTANGIALSNQHRKVKICQSVSRFSRYNRSTYAYVKRQARPRWTYVRRSSVTPDLVTGALWWEPPQRPVTRSFEVFFDLRLDKQLSKHSWGWWSETPSHSL